MIIMVDSKHTLPIDRRNQLSSQSVRKEKGQDQLSNTRSFLKWNRFITEGQLAKRRSGHYIQNDFDLLSGELITRKCDYICQNYYRWTKSFEINDHQMNVSYGNFDYSYYPSRWDRLSSTLAIEFNRKAKSRKTNLSLSSPKEYFIYRNGVLIRKGQGSFENIELDLSEENYFSNYTVKIIDENGQIQSYDLYNGLGLLNAGDYSLKAGTDQSLYHFASAQLGITSSINLFASFLNKDDSQYFVKRIKTDFGLFKFDSGELTNKKNSKVSDFLQGEISYKNLSYIYGQLRDKEEQKSQKNHSIMLNLLRGIFQFHHRILNESSFENEVLLGRQVKNNFLYARYQQFSDDHKKYSLNVSGQYLYVNYDLGPYVQESQLGVFALLSGSLNRFTFSSSFDLSKQDNTVSNRIEYNINNYSLYSLFRKTGTVEDYGIGLTYSIFPSEPNLMLQKKAESIIKLRIFLDTNDNQIFDGEDVPLENIGSYIRAKDQIKYTNIDGDVYFEQEESPHYLNLTIDETTFTKIYLLPPDKKIRLKINPRNINKFEIPIAVNGIIVIGCPESGNIKSLKIHKGDQLIFKTSWCKSSIFLDKQKAGEYHLTLKQGNANKELIINLSKENNFLKDVSLDE